MEIIQLCAVHINLIQFSYHLLISYVSSNYQHIFFDHAFVAFEREKRRKIPIASHLPIPRWTHCFGSLTRSTSLCCPCCLSCGRRTHSYSLFTLHLWIAHSSHIFHSLTRSHTYKLYTRWLFPSHFDGIPCRFSLLHESVSRVLSYSISIARFLSFFMWACVCTHFRHHYRVVVLVISYAVSVLSSRESNSNGDFMLKVTLFCQKWFYFLLFYSTNDWAEIAAAAAEE